MALDASGETLKKALEEVGLHSPNEGGSLASRISKLSTNSPGKIGVGLGIENGSKSAASDEASNPGDYFST